MRRGRRFWADTPKGGTRAAARSVTPRRRAAARAGERARWPGRPARALGHVLRRRRPRAHRLHPGCAGAFSRRLAPVWSLPACLSRVQTARASTLVLSSACWPCSWWPRQRHGPSAIHNEVGMCLAWCAWMRVQWQVWRAWRLGHCARPGRWAQHARQARRRRREERRRAGSARAVAPQTRAAAPQTGPPRPTRWRRLRRSSSAHKAAACYQLPSLLMPKLPAMRNLCI